MAMKPMPLVVREEIALEGLDGITLEALWFRISERTNMSLPFHAQMKQSLFNMVLKNEEFEFFKIATSRATPLKVNRFDFINTDETVDPQSESDLNDSYYIYSYDPVDDPVIRGSCAEFKTREKIDRAVLQGMKIADIETKFPQNLVIVASQEMRSKMLIPNNLGRECDINNHTYCILERIGRSRYFGETTSGKYSLNDFSNLDSKLLHYHRQSLLKNEIVKRQNICQRNNGKTCQTQIFHLPNYFVLMQPTATLRIEKLFCFLKEKPNHIAAMEEVRRQMNLKPKCCLTCIRSRPNLFLVTKSPYRELFPDANKEEYAFKNDKEKMVPSVKLIDPDFDLLSLYNNPEENEPPEEDGFLDCSNQKIKTSLLHQIVLKIEESGQEGLKQSEIGKMFGISKLNARACMKKVQKIKDIAHYMKDEGRQRTAAYISKKYLQERNKAIEHEVSKLLEKAEPAQLVPVQIVPDDQVTDGNDSFGTKVSIPLSVFQREQKSMNIIEFIEVSPTKFKDGEASNQVSVMMKNDECSFVDNVENVEVTLKFLPHIPGAQKQLRGIAAAIEQNKISQKLLSRLNLILDIVKKKTVIDGINLLQALRKEEENFAEIICRKSMFALCGRLAIDNFLKIIEMELKSESKTVKLLFFGAPNVTFDLRCWSSIIEEQKIQHFIATPRPMVIEKLEKQFNEPLVIESKASIDCGEYDAQSLMYENFPKFMKYRILHEFLYYLIYDYPENVNKIPIRNAVEIWKKENQRYTDFDEITSRISTCYTTEVGWKMFVPPLNPQIGFESGWGFLRDIIHRIPLILYVKFSRFSQTTPELNEYLKHPIKCNYLLHFLPQQMRTLLCQKRKHVFVVYELCKRLCWMGLLQYGPARSKEIDQTYVYLNRNASVIDTRSSEPGYLEVEDKEYPHYSYHFDTREAINDYWNQLFDVCINTKINKKSTAIGKVIELEEIGSKEVLQQALKVQTAETAPANDVGEIPGDKKGAGGLDKAFMSHLKKSWSRTIEKKQAVPMSPTFEDSDVKPKVKRERRDKSNPPKKRRRVKAEGKSRSSATSVVKGVRQQSKIIRKVLPKSQANKSLRKKIEFYDEVDREALKLMKTLRVTWSELEDKTLLLAKVASKFAFPNDAQCSYYVNCTIVRDILHWRSERSLNKTSRSCQRRIAYLMKNKTQFKEQMVLYLEELRTNREFVTKYYNLIEKLKKIYSNDKLHLAMKIHLVEMIYRMHQIFYKEFTNENSGSIGWPCEKEAIKLPNSYDELRKNFGIVNPSLVKFKYYEPQNKNEIEVSMLMSVIHSALCCANDKTDNSFHLFEAYKQFPDENLAAAVTSLRQLTIVSMNKNTKNVRMVLPYTASLFHLSSRYATMLMGAHIPVEVYDEYFNGIKTLSISRDTYQMKHINCGWLFMLTELLCAGKIRMTLEKADKLVMIDPALMKKTPFDKISDDYMMMKAKEIEKKVADKPQKSLRFQIDSNSDEKFIYNDDPIEIFYKLDARYLHLFCILQALEHNENIEMDKWMVLDDDECCLKNCLIRAGDNFRIEMQKIACHGFDMIKHILAHEDEGSSKYDDNCINKSNLIKFFDNVISKYVDENAVKMKKTLGKLSSNEFYRKISTKFLLEAIQRLACDVEMEDGLWIAEYMKISHNNEEDILSDDEEEVDQIKHAKMSHQLRDLNLQHRNSDSFVVNLSTIYVDVMGDYVENLTVDGESMDSRLIPFTEEHRGEILQKIRSEHVWTPENFAERCLRAELEKENVSESDMKLMDEIMKFLVQSGYDGATAKELYQAFQIEKNYLQKLTEILISLRFVLRAGVNELRFIHKDFAALWMVTTFNLIEEESEELDPPAKKAKIDDTSEEVNKNMRKKIFYLLPFPWLRVGPTNRIVNRRCIDKWLGTILSYVSLNPGIILSDLRAKFNVLTPVMVRHLCEILELIGCIKIVACKEQSTSIFADFEPAAEEPATYFDQFERTFIEVSVDAFQRLGFFIGKKKYKVPFV